MTNHPPILEQYTNTIAALLKNNQVEKALGCIQDQTELAMQEQSRFVRNQRSYFPRRKES